MFVDAKTFGLSEYTQKLLCLECTIYKKEDISLKKNLGSKFCKLTIRVVSCAVPLVLILRISSRLAFFFFLKKAR